MVVPLHMMTTNISTPKFHRSERLPFTSNLKIQVYTFNKNRICICNNIQKERLTNSRRPVHFPPSEGETPSSWGHIIIHLSRWPVNRLVYLGENFQTKA
jgi:hypothetical protein